MAKKQTDLTAINVSSVYLKGGSDTEIARASVNWLGLDGCRYHVWVTPSGNGWKVERATGAKGPTVYKNPPKDGSQNFRTRYLDATSAAWKPMIDALLIFLADTNMIEAARDRAADEKRRQREAEADARLQRIVKTLGEVADASEDKEFRGRLGDLACLTKAADLLRLANALGNV